MLVCQPHHPVPIYKQKASACPRSGSDVPVRPIIHLGASTIQIGLLPDQHGFNPHAFFNLCHFSRVWVGRKPRAEVTVALGLGAAAQELYTHLDK